MIPLPHVELQFFSDSIPAQSMPNNFINILTMNFYQTYSKYTFNKILKKKSLHPDRDHWNFSNIYYERVVKDLCD